MSYLINEASYKSMNDWRYDKVLVNLPTLGDGTKFQTLQEYEDFILERRKERELAKGELK